MAETAQRSATACRARARGWRRAAGQRGFGCPCAARGVCVLGGVTAIRAGGKHPCRRAVVRGHTYDPAAHGRSACVPRRSSCMQLHAPHPSLGILVPNQAATHAWLYCTAHTTHRHGVHVHLQISKQGPGQEEQASGTQQSVLHSFTDLGADPSRRVQHIVRKSCASMQVQCMGEGQSRRPNHDATHLQEANAGVRSAELHEEWRDHLARPAPLQAEGQAKVHTCQDVIASSACSSSQLRTGTLHIYIYIYMGSLLRWDNPAANNTPGSTSFPRSDHPSLHHGNSRLQRSPQWSAPMMVAVGRARGTAFSNKSVFISVEAAHATTHDDHHQTRVSLALVHPCTHRLARVMGGRQLCGPVLQALNDVNHCGGQKTLV